MLAPIVALVRTLTIWFALSRWKSPHIGDLQWWAHGTRSAARHARRHWARLQRAGLDSAGELMIISEG